MLELVKLITAQFVETPESVEYLVEETDDVINITIVLDESDMGKVIGKQGKIAKAMRTIVKAASSKLDQKYNIEIRERGEVI